MNHLGDISSNPIKISKYASKPLEFEELNVNELISLSENYPEEFAGVSLEKIHNKNDLELWGLARKRLREIELNKLKKTFGFFHKETNFINVAIKFYEIQPYYYDDYKIWWLWCNKEKKWMKIDETDILISLDDKTENPNTSSNIKTQIIEALRRVGRRNRPLDMKPTWVQFKSQIIDIETGERFTATHEYFATNPIPWDLDNNNFEDTPVMDRIFEEWVGKNNVKLLHEILAYCLLPDYPLSRIFCFLGAGMNGKSKFLELMKNFIGKDNCCSTELDDLIHSRFEKSRLHKKLVCQMGETNFEEISQTSILKKLTGGDLIGFEYKNKDLFHEINVAKIIIATNNLPTTTDKTLGFYRRWCIIDFPNQFSEKKDILAEIPKEEYNALALKSCVLLKDLLVKREFHNEGDIEARMSKYESKSDFLQKFLDEFAEHSVGDYISKSEFAKRFEEWCKENRHRTLALNTLGKKLKEKGFEPSRKYVNWMNNGKGGQINVFDAIRWKD